jgi:hypothetical protein
MDRIQLEELDASDNTSMDFFNHLNEKQFNALQVHNLISEDACEHISERLLLSAGIISHSDVRGLQVIGPSHFQAARDERLAEAYTGEARLRTSWLRSLAAPYGSPFDTALAVLAEAWSPGCKIAHLPTEGRLSPYTIRRYDTGAEISPHQDILAIESPNDPVANQMIYQFGANLYISIPAEGGCLEIFDVYDQLGQQHDLRRGPRVINRNGLVGSSRVIQPRAGDLILFPSHLVHAVTASGGEIPRITISFFAGVIDMDSPLMIWA